MTSGRLDDRVNRLKEEVARLGMGSQVPILIMTDGRFGQDPRLDALVAAARAEGRYLVQPWSETPDGQIVDHASLEYRRAMRAQQEVVELQPGSGTLS